MKPTNQYPVEYKGMKVRLLVEYLKWFKKNIPARLFDFTQYMDNKDHGIHTHTKYPSTDHPGQSKNIVKRLKTKPKKECEWDKCDSVGCFTGWAKHYSPIQDNNTIFPNSAPSTTTFAIIIGMNSDIADSLFIPYRSYESQSCEEFNSYFTEARNDSTKDEICARVERFIACVMNNEINPNPPKTKNAYAIYG